MNKFNGERKNFDLGWIQVLATKVSRVDRNNKVLCSFFGYDTETFVEVFKISCFYGETITCEFYNKNGVFVGNACVLQFDDLPEIYQDWLTS
jgi:hypothetical protein